MSYATEIVGGLMSGSGCGMFIYRYIHTDGSKRYDVSFEYDHEIKTYTWTDEIENIIEPLIDLFKYNGSRLYYESGEWILEGPKISDIGNNRTNLNVYTICIWNKNPFTDNLPNEDSWSSYTNYTLREVIIDNLYYYPGETM